MPVYSAHLREIIKKGVDHPEHYDQPLRGFRIVVDAGNGSGGFLASDVLAPLGADTSGAQPSRQRRSPPRPPVTGCGVYDDSRAGERCMRLFSAICVSM